jgi:hypothetical protein
MQLLLDNVERAIGLCRIDVASNRVSHELGELQPG